jgi:hypothetical protein
MDTRILAGTGFAETRNLASDPAQPTLIDDIRSAIMRLACASEARGRDYHPHDNFRKSSISQEGAQ